MCKGGHRQLPMCTWTQSIHGGCNCTYSLDTVDASLSLAMTPHSPTSVTVCTCRRDQPPERRVPRRLAGRRHCAKGWGSFSYGGSWAFESDTAVNHWCIDRLRQWQPGGEIVLCGERAQSNQTNEWSSTRSSRCLAKAPPPSDCSSHD
jgi:hypothetical protein